MATPAAPPTDGNKPSRTWKLSLSGPLVLERVLLAAGFVVLVIVNVAAGASNRRVSDRFSTPITPAGWAFSIWGLIFFLQAVGVVYAAIPWGYGRDDLDGGAKGRHVAAVALPWFCGVREVSGPFFWSEGSESELQKEKEGEKGREKEGEKGRKKEGEKGRKKGEKDRKEAHPRLFACPYQKKTPKWAFQDLWQFSFIPGTRVGMWFALLFIVAAFCCMAWGVVRLFAAGKASGPLPARNALAALAFAAFNVPASLNAAWLSAASVVAMLVVPASRGVARDAASVVWLGVALCAAITALAVYVALVKVSSKKKLFFFSRKSGRPERNRGKEEKTQKPPLKT